MNFNHSNNMAHASLFSGIGGFDLAAEWAGWENLFNCEIDPFCQRVLKYHFPYAKQFSDIRATDFSEWRGKVDVLTGGFPCQPFSIAGKRKGTEDERHLWPEFLRAIESIRPRWVVGENVFGIVNWSGGLVFEQVCSDLENAGYEVQPYVIPAAGVDAPHKRDRVWFVAHAKDPERVRCHGCEPEEETRDREQRKFGAGNNGRIFGTTGVTADSSNTGIGRWSLCCWRDVAHSDESVPQRSKQHRGIKGARAIKTQGRQPRRPIRNQWAEFPTKSPICGRHDGVPAQLDDISIPKWRTESIKAYGNAIVPQVAYQIFETINEYESKS